MLTKGGLKYILYRDHFKDVLFYMKIMKKNVKE